MNRQHFLRALVLGATFALGAGVVSTAGAQDFPSRAIRMMVPFNPGNSTDTIARRMAQLMSKKLNQPVIVENKPGANAAIAAQAVVSAPADGYTIFFASDSALVLNPLLYKKLAYNPERDFTAIALAANVPQVMLVNASVPAKNVQEFIAYARHNPGKLNFSSTGTGGAFHLAGEMFDQATGVEMTHIPYTGGAPALQALLADQVQVMFGVVGSALPYLHSGKLRALALVTGEPVAALPGVPTLHDSGYPDVEATIRYGLVARKQTPPEVLATLNDAASYALADPDYRKTMTDEGYLVPEPHKPTQYDQWLAADRVRWAAVIKARHISLD
ncbi:MAG: tripartite tricarboxylate transporter substrate binding protein [Burkholderiaceae bacterium]|jgi:tripartite-type tricarboxylate transporter receptor subunit TctC|nr:tripartite tricarboxylate transporter substrate binding protein [Burkholderiaceae bacterium]